MGGRASTRGCGMLPEAMRAAAAALLFFCAGALAAPIGEDGARHLLERTGFGASEADVGSFAPLEPEAAVDRLLAGTRREATLPPPAFVDEAIVPFYKLREMSPDERREAQRKLVAQAMELRAWWLR